MFQPKTDRIAQLALQYPQRIRELEGILSQITNVYIDYANIKPWATKLGWHVEPKRLKQFLDSFTTIRSIKFYNGTLLGDGRSERFNEDARRYGYAVVTKPVKVMRLSIDASSVSQDSTAILKDFVRKPLLQKLNIEVIEYLNDALKKLNAQGMRYVEDLKCNFDVEIGRDMLIDYQTKQIQQFVLWSGDSDFAHPIRQLLNDRKKVFVFATARRVSRELNDLRSSGLAVFDIQKIRDFICWKKEIR